MAATEDPFHNLPAAVPAPAATAAERTSSKIDSFLCSPSALRAAAE